MNNLLKTIPVLAIFMGSLAAQAVPLVYQKTTLSGGKVSFVKESTMTAEEFSKTNYSMKPDQAILQNNYRLTMTERMALSAKDFDSMTQEEIDQIYIRLSSGPIVPGKYKGSVLSKGNLAQKAKDLIYGSYKGIPKFGSKLCGDTDLLECVAELAWKGKRIYEPDPETGETMLKNAISKKVAFAIKAALTPWYDKFNFTNWLATTTGVFYGETKFMLFPAHVYCGQSLLDHRRESILIDYAWGSDFRSIKGIDELAGREYLAIRDEIRMVRPGLYLGRAYTNKIFLLNFVLYNPEAEAEGNKLTSGWPQDACFDSLKATR